MGKLIEFALGVLLGAFVGFLVFEGLFGDDPIQREGAERSKKAHCEAQKEQLLSPQSPQEFEHKARLYSKICDNE
jgi:hypothetical protein